MCLGSLTTRRHWSIYSKCEKQFYFFKSYTYSCWVSDKQLYCLWVCMPFKFMFGPRSFFILTPAIAQSVAAAVAIVEDLGTVVNPCVFSFCCSNWHEGKWWGFHQYWQSNCINLYCPFTLQDLLTVWTEAYFFSI